MKKKSLAFQYKFSFTCLIIVLALYSFLILSSHHYVRLTADITIYLDIANKYLQGDFTNAVNGYWGPMLSWLLIPFLYFGSSNVLAVNALHLIVGVLTITGVWILSRRFEIEDKIRMAIIIATLPIILFVSIVELFDFLLLCFLVFYLGIVFKKEYPQKIYYAVLCGMLGAFAYFSKSYGLPFFLIHFTIISAGHFFRSETREDKMKVVRNALVGIAVFFIISGPWIYTISSKYDYFTISNMGKGNFSGMAPGKSQTGFELGNPIFHQGFFAPPNETATSLWEDPSYMWETERSWSPLESVAYFKHFIKNSAKNVFECMRIYQSFSRLSIVIMIAFILLLAVRPLSRQILQGNQLFVFFTVLLYTSGYMPFHFELRYLWTVNILLMLMGGYVLTLLFQNDFFKSNMRKNILIMFFAASFMLTPLKSFVQTSKGGINQEMQILSTILKDQHAIQGNLASNREWEHIAIHESWHKTFRLASWLKSRYFGQARLNISDEELENELKNNNIDYYFIWGENAIIPQFLFQYKEIKNDEMPYLTIFSLKENG